MNTTNHPNPSTPMRCRSSIHGFALAASLLAVAVAAFVAPLTRGVSQTGIGSRDAADDTLINLDAITVSSTRTAWRAFDVPGMTSVVDSRALDLLQPQSMDEILRSLPNVELFGGPRRTAEVPRIRGRNSENILILIDGMRQNYSGAHRGRYFIEPDLLKSVEIVRGPNSALYGSGAQGGILSMETKTASDLLLPGQRYGSRLKTGYVSANDERFFGAAAYGSTGTVDLLASVTHREGGDIRLGTGEKLEFSGSELRAAMFKATWHIAPGQSLSLVHDTAREENIQPTNPQGNILSSIVNRKTKVEGSRARYVLHPAQSDWVDLEAVAYRVTTGNRDLGVSAGLLDRDERRSVRTTGFNLINRSRFEAAWLGTHRLAYGVDFFGDENVARRFDTGAGLPIQTSPEGDVDYAAVFLQDEIGLPGGVTLIPGLRYDRFKSKAIGENFASSDDDVSLKLGAVWRPLPEFFVFGLYSEGFLTPDVAQIFRSGRHFRIGARQQDFVPSLGLKPESARNYEGGLGFERKLASGARLQTKLSLFHQDSRDTISREVVILPVPAELAAIGITQYEQSRAANLEGAAFRGAELEFGYTTETWFVNGGASTLRSKVDGTGLKLSTTPADKLSLSGGRRFADARLTLGGSALFVGNRRSKVEEPQYQTHGYADFGLSAAWQPSIAYPDTTLNLTASNLFDKAYARDDVGRFATGRSVQATLTVKF
ncbi:TonB-dependent receptor domain-containing protein [Cephaloticoccus capnophilus]|nr:TonB-dependent receptor [Cephaloticoccus capnophilus]